MALWSIFLTETKDGLTEDAGLLTQSTDLQMGGSSIGGQRLGYVQPKR